MSFRWWSSCLTDPGKRRRTNEDAFFASDSTGLWVVADGMGGHLRGDVASRTVTDAFDGVAKAAHLDDYVKDVRKRLAVANQHIQQLSGQAGGLMGSTVVVFIALGASWACLWAGDCRAYRLSRGRLQQLTHDHSMMQEMIDRGDDEANIDPRFANRVTRAVGATAQLTVDEARGRVKDGDIFLLCSDGLIKELDDDELAPILDTYDCDEAARLLLDKSLERGARDNITVAVVHFESLTGTKDVSEGDKTASRTQRQNVTAPRAVRRAVVEDTRWGRDSD